MASGPPKVRGRKRRASWVELLRATIPPRNANSITRLSRSRSYARAAHHPTVVTRRVKELTKADISGEVPTTEQVVAGAAMD